MIIIRCSLSMSRPAVARSTSDGSLRLVPPDDGTPVDAARAARMAWWRALDIGVRLEAPAVF